HRVGHIFSTGQTNITSHLCGSGTVDGQGKDWGRFSRQSPILLPSTRVVVQRSARAGSLSGLDR
ncbi:MAG: hypothetical protein ACK6A7_04000, partial [Planctomycetota bacterium]